jgi:hypothetical protein
MKMKTIWLIFLTVLLSAAAQAQTFNVTAPTSGEFIGLTNTVSFNVNGASSQNKIRITATGPGSVQFTNNGDFTPDADGKINGTLSLNFNQGVPEGEYTIVVTAAQNNTVYATVTINVTLDVTKPKFLQFNPVSGAFVRAGIVSIRVNVLEPNFQDYRVQVDGQDIPNNTGTTLVNGEFTVNWDTSGIQFDGAKSISVRLRDQADNEESRTFDVTLDRINPTVIIVHPRAELRFAPRANISVAIDITDANVASTDVTGVDVIARTLEGQFLARVAVQTFRPTNGPTNRWTGRLRWTNRLPKKFKLVVHVIDKAGNSASTQEVIVQYR